MGLFAIFTKITKLAEFSEFHENSLKLAVTRGKLAENSPGSQNLNFGGGVYFVLP